MSRPKFKPTDEQRRTVKSLSAFGIKIEGIAKVIGLRSPKTLRKHFKIELTLGAIEGVAQVAQTHHKMATSGKYPASTIHFIDKHQRWLENQTAETKSSEIPAFVVILDKDAA